jgi:hypothetical protein
MGVVRSIGYQFHNAMNVDIHTWKPNVFNRVSLGEKLISQQLTLTRLAGPIKSLDDNERPTTRGLGF